MLVSIMPERMASSLVQWGLSSVVGERLNKWET